jgi:hypothetical protein
MRSRVSSGDPPGERNRAVPTPCPVGVTEAKPPTKGGHSGAVEAYCEHP